MKALEERYLEQVGQEGEFRFRCVGLGKPRIWDGLVGLGPRIESVGLC